MKLSLKPTRWQAHYTITARAVGMTNTNSGAHACVMLRETLDAGSTMANINLAPANGVTWLDRTTTDGMASSSLNSAHHCGWRPLRIEELKQRLFVARADLRAYPHVSSDRS